GGDADADERLYERGTGEDPVVPAAWARWLRAGSGKGELAMRRDIIHSQIDDVPHEMTSTTFDIPGYHVVRNLGVVRGVVVRSRSIVGTAFAGIQTIFGGN